MTTVNRYLSEDRYFDPDHSQRKGGPRSLCISRRATVGLPPWACGSEIALVDSNFSFGSPTELSIIPDHYIFRMLYSQGIALEDLGVPRADGGPVETDHRKIWQIFAENIHRFEASSRYMATG